MDWARNDIKRKGVNDAVTSDRVKLKQSSKRKGRNVLRRAKVKWVNVTKLIFKLFSSNLLNNTIDLRVGCLIMYCSIIVVNTQRYLQRPSR